MAKGAFIGVPTIIPASTPLGDKAVGDIVKLNVGGVAVDFIVVHQGNPDATLYDASCDGTWLLMKDIYEEKQWNVSGGGANYQNSAINTYLNADFLNLLDSNIQSVIKQVKIPYAVSNGTVYTKENGLSTKVFLLSALEVGGTSTSIPDDGVALSYFDAASKRYAYLNGEATAWFLRTPNTSTSNIYNVTTSATVSGTLSYTATRGIRPALILPSTLGVEEDGTVLSAPATEGGETVEVAREVKKMFVGVDGVARKVKKAWVGVNGVARMFYGSLGLSLADLPVGTLIRTNVGGVAKNFIVVHQGNPSASLYDSSCDGTWLLMQDIYESRSFGTINNNSYAASNIHAYLNDSFFELLDSDIRTKIKQIKIPYVNGVGSTGVIASGSSGLSTKTFLLSGYEVGFTTSTDAQMPEDGTCLSYFSGANNSKRIAYYNGSASTYGLRSPRKNNAQINAVSADGGWMYAVSYLSCGVRPAFILPSDLMVNPTPNADGSYTLLA